MTNNIIVHDGGAHQDDFLASCVCLFKLQSPKLYRRKYEETDLITPDCWVLDQGKKYEPECHNFDHHQIEEEICAFTQVLDYFYGKDYRIHMPQLRYIEIFDSYGPKKAAEFAGFDEGCIDKIQSPIVSSIINIFSNMSGEISGSILEIMKKIGEDICEKIEKNDYFLKKLDKSIFFNFNNIKILDVSKCEVEKKDYYRLPTKIYSKLKDIYPDVILTIDNRQDGYRMLSSNTDVIKFKENKYSYFTHNSGFLTGFNNFEDYEKILLDHTEINKKNE